MEDIRLMICHLVKNSPSIQLLKLNKQITLFQKMKKEMLIISVNLITTFYSKKDLSRNQVFIKLMYSLKTKVLQIITLIIIPLIKVFVQQSLFQVLLILLNLIFIYLTITQPCPTNTKRKSKQEI